MTVERSTARGRTLVAGLTAGIDGITAEVVDSLRNAGVRTILLKGPSVGRWLYERSLERPYGDIDLLIAPDDARRAANVLAELDFVRRVPEGVHREESADTWLRRSITVDLHRTLTGAAVPDGELWRVLSGNTETMDVAGTEVEVLAVPARALHVALHAMQHGAESVKPLRDLSRALELLPRETWEWAAELAARLRASAAFAAGLRLLPAGRALAAELGLSDERSVRTELRARGATHLALGLDRLAETPGFAGKATLVARKAVPEPAFLRAWTPLARRGPLGLALAYVWRPLYLLVHAGPALRAWWKVRRELGSPRSTLPPGPKPTSAE